MHFFFFFLQKKDGSAFNRYACSVYDRRHKIHFFLNWYRTQVPRYGTATSIILLVGTTVEKQQTCVPS